MGIRSVYQNVDLIFQTLDEQCVTGVSVDETVILSQRRRINAQVENSSGFIEILRFTQEDLPSEDWLDSFIAQH